MDNGFCKHCQRTIRKTDIKCYFCGKIIDDDLQEKVKAWYWVVDELKKIGMKDEEFIGYKTLVAEFLFDLNSRAEKTDKAVKDVQDAIHLGVMWQEKAEKYKQTAEQLWDLLDEISTFDDACKSDDAAFRKMIYQVAERRHEIIKSDGYNLIWPKK